MRRMGVQRLGVVLAGLALALALWGARPAAAQPQLELTQKGIAVEATAEDGVKARETALHQGRRAAWNRMLSQAGLPPRNLSDAQIDGLVQSIMVEQERTSPTRYSGRITVNFSPRAVQRQVGSAATVAPGGASAAAGATIGPDGVPVPPAPAIRAEAMASYGSLQEWQELRRRLRNSSAVAGVELRGIATDGARMRLSLRRPPEEAMRAISGVNATLMPAPAAGQAEYWQLSLAGG